MHITINMQTRTHTLTNTCAHAEKLASDASAVAAIDFFNVQMYNQIPFKSPDQVGIAAQSLNTRANNAHISANEPYLNAHLHAFAPEISRYVTIDACTYAYTQAGHSSSQTLTDGIIQPASQHQHIARMLHGRQVFTQDVYSPAERAPTCLASIVRTAHLHSNGTLSPAQVRHIGHRDISLLRW